jgi:hypothetical protein
MPSKQATDGSSDDELIVAEAEHPGDRHEVIEEGAVQRAFL